MDWPATQVRVRFYDCQSHIQSLAFEARLVGMPKQIRELSGPFADGLRRSGRYCLNSRRPISSLPEFELVLADALETIPGETGPRTGDSYLLRDDGFLFMPTALRPKAAYGFFLDEFHRGPWSEATVLEVTRLFFELSGASLIDSQEALGKATWDFLGQDLPEGVEEGVTAGLETLEAKLPEDPRPRVHREEGGFSVHLFASWGGFPDLEEWVVHFPDRGLAFDVEIVHDHGWGKSEDAGD